MTVIPRHRRDVLLVATLASFSHVCCATASSDCPAAPNKATNSPIRTISYHTPKQGMIYSPGKEAHATLPITLDDDGRFCEYGGFECKKGGFDGGEEVSGGLLSRKRLEEVW